MDSYSYPMVECIPVSPRTDLFLKTNTQLSLGTSFWVGLGKDKVELNKTMLASQPDQIKKKSNSANTVQMSNLEKIFWILFSFIKPTRCIIFSTTLGLLWTCLFRQMTSGSLDKCRVFFFGCTLISRWAIYQAGNLSNSTNGHFSELM